MKDKIQVLKENIWIDFLIILLAILSVALLIFELSADLLAEQIAIIHSIDLFIALIFLTHFMLGIYLADDRLKYFKQNWPDLIASIPITEGVFRSLRLLRLLRLVRITRVIARIRRIGIIADRLADESSKYIYISAVTITIVLAGAVSFFTMELDANPDVNNFFDAVWWSVVTTTTVGYGDIYPVTIEGRIIGMILMIFGIGLVGTTAGLVGSYFIKNKEV